MKTIKGLKQVIKKHPAGHLPLPYRAELMRQISDPITINKIFFECAKQVFPIWESEYEGYTPVYEMLQKADAYLYARKGKKAEFLKLADNNKNYIEMLNSDAGAAGLTALYLCYSIASDASFDENYNGIDDDDAFDYEDFLPDYYGSIAYSGGNPFNDSGDEEKRREYWNWYLSMSETLVNNSQKPLLPLTAISPQSTPKEHFTRSEYAETNDIKENILEVIRLAEEMVKEKTVVYDKLRIEGKCMKSGISFNVNVVENNEQHPLVLGIDDFLSYRMIGQIFNKVKKEMYSKHPEEGAWCICRLLIDKKQNYEITFEYDDKDIIYHSNMSDNWFVTEFKHFPRAKEYTPKWWQTILGKKAKYLTEGHKRTQSHEKYEVLIQEIIRMTAELLKRKEVQYDTCRIDMSATFNNTYNIYALNNGKQSLVELSIAERLKFRPIDLFCLLKENMYKQAPEEGAWLNCSLIIEGKDYKIKFNYDDKENLFDTDINSAILVAEFEEYPRAKEYTPDWWQRILGKKVKYLK